ncbi:hypothetical protein [Tateyamaria sp. SN3-11]|uniref:hypothetical protein n=1 Tax=Tateyamaria sp. SN3-11 TaxID=3092147 RepID=UPI0039E72E9D
MSKPEILAATFIWLCAGGVVALCLAAIIIDYNAMPFWDSWDGLVRFVLQFPDAPFGEKLSSLVGQHNEHRFFFTRLLFLADNALFNSSFVLLYAFNAVIPLLGVWIVLKCCDEKRPFVRAVIAAISLCFVYHLFQRENFTWEFQSQFFLAYYLPLLGYFLIIRFWSHNLLKNAVMVVVMALMSAFTMANGVLFALPLVLLFVWHKETRATAFVALLVLVAILALYLVVLPYTSNAGHGSFTKDVLPNLGRYILYILTYIGSPFGQEVFFGAVFVICFVRFVWLSLARESMIDLRNVLLLYILFYGATVSVTGIGRVNFGVEQALGSRYLTPTLLAWLCLLVLGLLRIKTDKWHRRIYYGALPFLALVAIVTQVDKFKDAGGHGFERDTARLALYLGVQDEDAIERVYPVAETPIAVFARGKEVGLNFTKPMEAWTRLGDDATASGTCLGSVEDVTVLEDGVTKITGWIVNPNVAKQPPTPVFMSNGKAVGLGTRGKYIGNSQSEDAFSGFTLYVPASEVVDDGAIHSGFDAQACTLPL